MSNPKKLNTIKLQYIFTKSFKNLGQGKELILKPMSEVYVGVEVGIVLVEKVIAHLRNRITKS
jgi:hypothetical protein